MSYHLTTFWAECRFVPPLADRDSQVWAAEEVARLSGIFDRAMRARFNGRFLSDFSRTDDLAAVTREMERIYYKVIGLSVLSTIGDGSDPRVVLFAGTEDMIYIAVDTNGKVHANPNGLPRQKLLDR